MLKQSERRIVGGKEECMTEWGSELIFLLVILGVQSLRGMRMTKYKREKEAG